MNILIAPNAFKHSLDAETAAAAITEGLFLSPLDCTCECFPIGDGGDGTGDLIVKRCKGEFITTTVHDPLGKKISASFGLIDNGATAVIEMAAASGICLLSTAELNPLQASSVGTGELIKHALDLGVKKLIISMGGSATVDGGAGILQSLGVQFRGPKQPAHLPENLRFLEEVDLSGLDPRISACEIMILCDVENTLLGASGAAAVFGPQKGASKEEVPLLEAGLKRFADIALKQIGKDAAGVIHGGTAGGAAAGLYAFLNAKLVNGIDYFLHLTGFDIALQKADLLITGEGSIDRQTLQGKGPFGVASRAKNKGIPVIGLAGKIPLVEDAELTKFFDVLMPIGNEPAELAEAFENTKDNLIRSGREIGSLLRIGRQ